jgi:hypothetical protein
MKTQFEIIAELLGIKYVKKYGIEGSFWNKSHMNPKNEQSLYCLKEKCNNTITTADHNIFKDLSVIFILWICGMFLQSNWAVFKFVVVILTYRLCDVITSYYNIILIDRALGKIKKDENAIFNEALDKKLSTSEEIPDNTIKFENDMDILKDTPYIIASQYRCSAFYVKIRGNNISIGPSFEHKSVAEKFALKLHKFYVFQDVLLMEYGRRNELLTIAENLLKEEILYVV